jgi:hypothetical protein
VRLRRSIVHGVWTPAILLSPVLIDRHRLSLMTSVALTLAASLRGAALLPRQQASSARQIFLVCWSRVAYSLRPQRKSIAWKRQPCRAHGSRRRGKTVAWSALCSATRSLKVELTNMRKVFDAGAIHLFPLEMGHRSLLPEFPPASGEPIWFSWRLRRCWPLR